MSQTDRYFDEEIKAIALSTREVARAAAEELYDEVRRQIRQNFRNPSTAFYKGVKLYEFDSASYVRLSPIVSSHAESTSIKGSPSLWILLPDGARLGFKRMGTGGTSWDSLRRRYSTRLSFAPVANGHVVLFRDRGAVYPIYKIQNSVQTKQRIRFFEKAEEIARNYGFKERR